MRVTSFITFIAGLLIVIHTQEVAAAPLAQLDQFLIHGESEGWKGGNNQGAYWLENPTQEGSIRYFYTPHKEGTGGQRRITIDVDVSNTRESARAGLLYGLSGEPLSYFMLLIGRGGEVELYRRDASGVNLLMGSSVDLLPGFNRVEIHENGSNIGLVVNEKSVGSIESTGTGDGAVGIAAMGVGRFGFANYGER